MSRPFLTLLRKHGFSRVLPIDHHVEYHKLIGLLLVLFSVIHTIAHLVNIGEIAKVILLLQSCNFLFMILGHNLEGNHFYFTAQYNNMTGVSIANYTYGQWLLTDAPGVFGLIPGWGFPTGVFLILVLVVMGGGVHPWIRRNGHFEVGFQVFHSDSIPINACTVAVLLDPLSLHRLHSLTDSPLPEFLEILPPAWNHFRVGQSRYDL